MATEQSTRGGTHEQHVKAGQQSHKNTGGAHDEDMGAESHKNGGSSGSSQGGTHEQHVKAGQQSHKND